MTVEELSASVQASEESPQSLSGLMLALWHAKKCAGSARSSHWTAAHDIAQDVHTPDGSWVHALLHLIEGDQWNADYWFAKAGRPSRKPEQVEALWAEIVVSLAR
jgi:hypothetical protein